MNDKGLFNGHGKPIGIGTITGIVVALVATVTLNFAIMDRVAASRSRLDAVEAWQANYNKNVGPLRDEFLRFMGEVPSIRAEMIRSRTESELLRKEMERLNARLDRLEGRRP